MKNKRDTLALKPYLESIRNYCHDLSRAELLEILSKIAQNIPAQKRTEFMEKIHSFSKGKIEVPSSEDILSQIRNLRDEVNKRIASIEDGTYCEDDGFFDEYYSDESPDFLSGEQKEKLEGFYEDAGHLFLSGQLGLAGKVYEALFDFFYKVDENGFSSGISEHDIDIDFREEMSRYCRSIYETSSPDERVQKVKKALQINAPMNRYHFDLSQEKYPMLQDVVDAETGNMPDWENFLLEWTKMLRREICDRASILLLEAVNWLEGVEGVANLAKKWGALQPRGYLFWLHILISSDAWKCASLVAKETLDALPNGNFRVQAAGIMVSAGEVLCDIDLVLKGKREKFYSLPTDYYLIDLIKEAETQDKRSPELEKSLNYLETKKDMLALKIKVLLMSGKLNEAFAKAKNGECIGWSYDNSATGILYGGILTALTNRKGKVKIITGLLKRYSDNRTDMFEMLEEGSEDRKDTDVSDEILKGLDGIVVLEKDKIQFLTWATRIGPHRIDHIVSNKHRKAYGRAAEVLGALAECFALEVDKNEGRHIIKHYRDRKYSRFPAFKRELDEVLKQSVILT